jgi:hypothetical protein
MSGQVQVSPFHHDDLSLAGLLLHGRWPETVREWAQVLFLAVRIAAVPGAVPTTEVFRARDDVPVEAEGDPIGLVTCEGPAIGADAPAPGSFSVPAPLALMVLHPPSETPVEMPEDEGAASGCLLLPGIPELGLEHRAAWVQADARGQVLRLVRARGMDPMSDPDLAVLAALLAA